VCGDRALRGLDGRRHRQPRPERLCLSLCVYRRQRLVPERVPGGTVRFLADDQAADRRGGLQPRRGIDDVPGRQRLPGGAAECHDRLTRVHGRARRQAEIMRRVQLLDPLQHPKARAHGALCVIAVRDGRPEHGHHRVAD